MFNILKASKILNDDNYHNHLKGPIIKLSSLNEYLFGNKVPPLKNPIWHYDSTNIFIDFDDEKYIRVDKIKKYFDIIGDLKNEENKHILVNYYKLNNINLSDKTFNYQFNTFLTKFREYLNLKKDKSINKSFYKILKMYFNNEYNKYRLVNHCDILNVNTVLFEITKECKVSLSFGQEDKQVFLDKENYIYSHPLKGLYTDSFDKTYEYFINKLKKISPKDFIINNLTRVTGSKEFSKQLYFSHKEKDECKINCELISLIVNWKSKNLKEKYVSNFKESNTNYFDSKLENLNFIGFNNFFLNIESSYLVDKKEKQRINDFYIGITKELISSWEELYNDMI